MRNVLWMVLLALGLVALSACGSDGAADDGQVDDTPDEEESTSSDDPIEVIEDSSIDSFETSEDDYNLTRYTSDDADDDGFIHIDVDGYKIKFSLAAGQGDYNEEDKVFLLGEQENTNDDGGEMQLNNYDMTTDEGAKIDDGWNFTSVEPGAKDKVANEFDLEYDIPDEIELRIESVHEDDGASHDVDKTYTFTKE